MGGIIEIKWENVPNPEMYVKDTLALEAIDIPVEKINQGKWFLDTLLLDSIEIDNQMVFNHDKEQEHIKRRDDFISSIRSGIKIKPLIVLGENLFLVDGYARYRALKKMDIKEAQALRQEIK